MSAPPPEQDRLTSFVRRSTERPTMSFFRALNFELYTRNNLSVALPGTVLFAGVVAYFALQKPSPSKFSPAAEEEEDD